jgi:hypothetical protein
VIKNKIVLATTDKVDRDESGGLLDELLDAITDEQVAQVREYATDGTEQAGSNTSGGRGSTEETTMQHPDMAPDEHPTASSEATAVRTDGGETEP